MKIRGARWAAVKILSDRFQRQIPLDAGFQQPFFTQMEQRDRAFARELVSGTLRSMGTLDYCVRKLGHRPLEKIDKEVLWILRISLYQLEYLRTPDYAVISEAVNTARQIRKSRATGFINGLLRSFQRNPPALPKGDSASALAVRYSHPEWLVCRYVRRYGLPRAEHFLEQNNQPPLTSVWVNSFKIGFQAFIDRLRQEGIAFEVDAGLSNCVQILDSGFVEHPLYRSGCCFFMDPASQAVANYCKVTEGGLIADLCAAPGGKSFLIAGRLAARATLICSDRSLPRLQQMVERSRLYGIERLRYLQMDATQPAFVPSRFDCVLLDAPCSGLSTIRANPDIRWALQESDLARMQRRQLDLLEGGFRCLKPGGRLIYATCSSEPEENEAVVDRFLDRKRTARLVEVAERKRPSDYFIASFCSTGSESASD